MASSIEVVSANNSSLGKIKQTASPTKVGNRAIRPTIIDAKETEDVGQHGEEDEEDEDDEDDGDEWYEECWGCHESHPEPDMHHITIVEGGRNEVTLCKYCRGDVYDCERCRKPFFSLAGDYLECIPCRDEIQKLEREERLNGGNGAEIGFQAEKAIGGSGNR
jgi:hypothetical protein